MSKQRNYIPSTIKLHFCVILVVAFIGVIFSNSDVGAIGNNRANILRSWINGHIGGGSPTVNQSIGRNLDPSRYRDCAGVPSSDTGNHGGSFSWLSPDSNTEVSTISLGGAPPSSMTLRLNFVGYTCDSGLKLNGNIDGAKIPDNRAIRKSRNVSVGQPQVSSVARQNSSGSFVDIGHSLGAAFNDSKSYAELNFGTNWWKQQRFIKSANTYNHSDRDNIPAWRRIQLSNTNTLTEGVYRITVRLRTRITHEFWLNNDPARPSYYCQVQGEDGAGIYLFSAANLNGIPASINRYNSERDIFTPGHACGERETYLTINLKVMAPYDGECEVVRINGIPVSGSPISLAAGTSFGAEFRIRNTGYQPWNRSYIKLGSNSPPDNTTWNRMRANVPSGSPNPIPNNGSWVSFTTPSDWFTAPDKTGVESFDWRILQEGTSPVVNDIGFCGTNINIFDSRNRPYVRGTTQDIRSGAVFGDDCSPGPSNGRYSAAQNAKIIANSLNAADALNGERPGFEEALILVARLYAIADGPNPIMRREGALFWIDRHLGQNGGNEITTIAQFLNSSEVNLLTGGSTENFVTRMYQGLYSRSPTFNTDPENPGELQYWVGRIEDAGDSMTRQHAARFFISTNDRAPFGILGSRNYNYGGSGSDYGVFSTGSNNISDGLGGMVGGNGYGQSQADVFNLTFANGLELKEFDYGYFSDTPLCLPDFYKDYEVHAGNLNAANLVGYLRSNEPDGVSVRRIGGDNITIDPSIGDIEIPGNTLKILLVDGNITIGPNIIYEYDDTIPALGTPGLIVIAKGNITTTQYVSRLEGIYIAQPRSATEGGMISTCELTGNQRAGDHGCSQRQLKVKGSLIAQRLRLLRTHGSIGATFQRQDGTFESGNLAPGTTCSALQNFWGDNQRTFALLYSTSSVGTVNKCAAEWVDAHPERYFMHQDHNSIDDTQSFRDLPPIF